MSTTPPESLMIPGGFGPQAAFELAAQIDGTGSAPKLIAFGFSVPLANELVAQMLAGTGIVSNLMALGVPPSVATAIKTAIDA